ncbi:hypothetical protein [Nostoc sp. CALU 546]
MPAASYAYATSLQTFASLDIQKIIYSESVLRLVAYIFLGHAPIAKIVFP